LIKVGTLDEPSVFDGPQLVTWTAEMEKFHLLPANVPAYPEIPRPKTLDKPQSDLRSSETPGVTSAAEEEKA
jgi:hypothetical protein